MKSIIRTPKKTFLFFFLLIILTIFINIGARMYDSACSMLLDADKTYTTVTELKYLGDSDVDEISFYKTMNSDLLNFDFKALENHKNVKSVDMEKTAWAFIDNNAIKRDNTVLSNYIMVKINNITKYKDDPYMGVVKENLYGKRARENSYIVINDLDEQGNSLNYNFINDHEYLVIGKITNEKSPMLILSPGMSEITDDIPCIIDLTENPDFLLSKEGKQILKLKDAITVVDNSLPVTTVSSLEASEPYYFNDLVIEEGRIFNHAEYQENQNKVILINETIASYYHVRVGDRINLKLHYNKSGIGLSDYLLDSKFAYESSYEIVGILENREDYKYTIFMPDPNWLKQDFHTTTVARYIVKNGTGADFINDTKDLLLPNMEFMVYDQGYAEATEPIYALKNNAIMIIVLGLLSCIAILILYSYLFVIKQKDTLKTMISLGTGKSRTAKYILYGSTSLIFCATTIGSIISFLFLNNVTKLLYETIKNSTYGSDLRYSERSFGLQMNYVPEVRTNLWLFIMVILFILVVNFIHSLFLCLFIISENKKVRKYKSIKKEKVSLSSKKLTFGNIKPIALKFALTSMIRSFTRSFIVPLISFILSIFIVFLGLLSTLQQEKLDTVYDRIPVTAYVTSLHNNTREIGAISLHDDIYRLINPNYSYRMDGDITLYNDYLNNVEYTSLQAEEERNQLLKASEYFDKINLYKVIRYEYMGISKTKDNKTSTEQSLPQFPNIREHNNAFGYDWFLSKIGKMPKLAYADDIRYTPDYVNSNINVDFLAGYNYESLQLRENIAMISRNFATANDIQNGDTIRITAWVNFGNEAACSVIDVKVVGIYNSKWKTDTIYIPWIMSYDHNYYIDSDYPLEMNDTTNNKEIWNELLPRNITSVTFTLKNTDKLSDFRDYLETEGYSQLGKINSKRRVFVIQDKYLAETIQNLTNHIKLVDTIKQFMLILFGILGFVVSYLLIKHRVDEMAIMRSLGAKKGYVFFAFFLEQFILFFIGLAPVIVYVCIFPSKVVLYSISLFYFTICYLLGTALALIIISKANVLDVLFTKE
jgi:ABC-type antimicrobial peptide transport system permease subunit